MENHTIDITVINWEKYNKQSERYRHPSWFLIKNDVIASQSLLGLSTEQKWLWIIILSECSRKNSGNIRLRIKWLINTSSLSVDSVKEAIEILTENGAIIINAITDCQLTDSKLSIDNTTYKQTNKHNAQKLIAAPKGTPSPNGELDKFDFDRIYQQYPRKLGKKQGMLVCRRQITTQAKYDALQTALNNYKAEIERLGTKPEYIKHFSTFMNNWEDYLVRAVETPKFVLDFRGASAIGSNDVQS